MAIDLNDLANSLGKTASDQDYFNGLKAQQVPAFQGLTGPDGKLLPQYQLNAKGDIGYNSNLDALNAKLNGINLNRQPLDQLEQYASSTGNSPWADLQLQQEALQRGQQMDSTAAGNNSGIAKAYSGLATRGGVSAGARERIATQGAKDLMTSRQGVNQAGDTARLGIMSTDAAQKLATMQQLPGMEINALQPELQKTSAWTDLANSENQQKTALAENNRQYATGVDQANIASQTANTTNLNAYNMAKYQEQMKAWGADRTATATEKSGKK